MRKLALFVEGQTELLFFDRFIREIASSQQIEIETYRATGGQSCPLKIVRLNLKKHTNPSATHYVQIIDCTSDGNVKSYIRDRYDSVVAAGFSFIIGVRDLFPAFDRAQLNSVRVNLMYGMRTKPIIPLFVLGVMEIESWFISEWTHFAKIDPSLTQAKVASELGYDPESADVTLRENPARDLHAVYASVGKSYTKRMNSSIRTVKALDMAQIYLNIRTRIQDCGTFCQTIEAFLT